MSSAMERAVEAAREAGRQLAGNQPGALREAFGDVAVAGSRAAFPILAEEVVAWHDEEAHAAERYAKLAQTLAARQEWEFVASTHRSHAATLRARIQQMAEAE